MVERDFKNVRCDVKLLAECGTFQPLSPFNRRMNVVLFQLIMKKHGKL